MDIQSKKTSRASTALSETEREKLTVIAHLNGTTTSDVLRRLVNAEHERVLERACEVKLEAA